MEPQWMYLTIIVVCLPVLCLCEAESSAGTHVPFGNGQSHFVSPHGDSGFQSWTDWLDKRSFGEFPFGGDNFQAWKEWMDKRSLLYSGSGPQFGANYDKNLAFQHWTDWMKKRGFTTNGHPSFKGLGPMSKAQFQSWSDWMTKRSMGALGGPASGANMFKQPIGGNFQSWSEFSKKNFGSMPDFEGLGGMQQWHFNKKRFGAVEPSNPFGVPFDAKPNMMKWEEMFKRKNDKRQLGNAPAGFGRYRPFFQSGLQDWRNTFQNSKRTTNDAKNSKQENN